MALYKLEWKPSVESDFKKIDRQHIRKIIEKAKALTQNPHPPDSKKLKDSKESYRIRMGDYRVLYQVNAKQKIILIHTIRHRKDVYRRR